MSAFVALSGGHNNWRTPRFVEVLVMLVLLHRKIEDWSRERRVLEVLVPFNSNISHAHGRRLVMLMLRRSGGGVGVDLLFAVPQTLTLNLNIVAHTPSLIGACISIDR